MEVWRDILAWAMLEFLTLEEGSPIHSSSKKNKYVKIVFLNIK